MGGSIYSLPVCNANCELIVHKQETRLTITKRIGYLAKASLTKDLSQYLPEVAPTAGFSVMPAWIPGRFF